MRIPDQLVEIWAAGTDGRGKCGSGWIVGQTGVLSCRHLLERYLSSVNESAKELRGSGEQARIQIRQASASSAADWVDCSIKWQHPVRDLVLLQVTPQPGQSWDPTKKRPSRLAGTGQLPSDCIAMGFPDAEAKPAGLRDSEQSPGKLLAAGAARDPSGLVPFDVDSSVPGTAALWEGFSGSAVVDQRTRLIGLVIKAHPARQQRRLLVVPIEYATSDSGFAAAATAVGLNPVVEDYWAPWWKQSVEPRALTATGVPPVIADVTDLKVFGVHDSSAAARGSLIGYVNRDKDLALAAALTKARDGGRRIVLVTGDSAAGKSRSAAEILRRDPVLSGWRLVVPLSDDALSHLAATDPGWHDTVLWLDDLDKYLARGLDMGTLSRILGDDPAVLVVATMRTSQLQARQGQLADPAWGFLTDESEVTRVDLEASLNDDELQAASAEISDPALLSALSEGTGLGEWLVAGPELMKKLNDGSGLNLALADIVIAWYRTGLAQPLAEADARRLWTHTLSLELQQRLSKRSPSEQSELFKRASVWACAPVIRRELYEQALITKENDGYVAHDYVVDQIVRNPQRSMVPESVWEQALQVAVSNLDPDQRSRRIRSVGAAAYQERALAHAMTAMRTLAGTGDVNAWLNVGVLLRELGRPEEEIGVYDQVIDRFGEAAEPRLRELAAKTMVGKSARLGQLDRAEEAIGIYDQVIDRFGRDTEPGLREQVATAMVDKGATLGQLGRAEEEIRVYDQVIDRFAEDTEPVVREQAAKAMVGKGVTLGQLGRAEEEIRVYDQVIDRFGEDTEPAVREQTAKAMVNKGARLVELGRPEEAVGTFDQVADWFGEDTEPAVREQTARAMVNKGITQGKLGRPEEAIGTYDQVIDRFGEDTEPAVREETARAMLGKGITLGQLDRPEEAAGVYDQMADRFGEDTEPALRKLVVTALRLKAGIEGQL